MLAAGRYKIGCAGGVEILPNPCRPGASRAGAFTALVLSRWERLTNETGRIIISFEVDMKSLVLNVNDNVYEKVIDFLKLLPQNKIRIVEEIPCSKELAAEIKKRKREIAAGKVLTHDELWDHAGVCPAAG